MSIIRKRRGNILIAAIMFALAIAVVICGFFFGPSGKSLSFFSLAMGSSVNITFKNIIDSLKSAKINWVFLIAYAAPFVTSFLALIFRKYRTINLINFLAFLFAVLIPSIASLTLGASLSNLLKSYDVTYVIMLGLQLGGAAFAFINLELCR